MLNLVKLCVGISAIEELQASMDYRKEKAKLDGVKYDNFHTTRMVPKRRGELLSGGSLYWVIKGKIQIRQILTDITLFKDGQGISRCNLVLEPRLIPTYWQPRRAFQGWRYLKNEDAPDDLERGQTGIATLPPQLRIELSNLGLL